MTADYTLTALNNCDFSIKNVEENEPIEIFLNIYKHEKNLSNRETFEKVKNYINKVLDELIDG